MKNNLIYRTLLFCFIANISMAQPVKKTIVHTQLLVIGGSTGGTAAAIQAARMGIQTVLVEETPWLGGMLSAAGVTGTDGNQDLASGIWEAFRQALYTHYHTKKLNTGWVSNTLFEPHVADSIFKSWASKETSLQCLYGWYFDTALVKNNTIIGATFLNQQKEKLTVYADLCIDATDLGDVYASAGAAFNLGMDDVVTNGEKEAPGKNDIIQDLTWAAVLKDYEKPVDKSLLIQPADFAPINLKQFDCSTADAPCPIGKPYQFKTQKVLDYGKLPNHKYMLNWPAHGNDYYMNGINIKPINRYDYFLPARKQTLAFVYYLQQILGFKNIGIDTTEFSTKDHLAFMPYHREGRRLTGIVTLSIPYLNNAFTQSNALYRTGIAVGDYPVDHHHGKNPAAPSIAFPSIYSYNIPLGSLIPEKLNGMVVCEKGISVSNLVNGTSRLQPCVLLTGQSAGILAAVAIQDKCAPRLVSVRKIQALLLKQKGYLMPYIDIQANDTAFEAIQKIGATGILRGFGKKEAWVSKTYFYPDSLCNAQALWKDLNAFIHFQIENPFTENIVTENTLEKIQPVFKKINPSLPKLLHQSKSTPLTRKQVALWLINYCDPFSIEVNHFGNLLINNKQIF